MLNIVFYVSFNQFNFLVLHVLKTIHFGTCAFNGVCTDTNVIYQSVLEKKTYEDVYRKRHNVVT